MCLKVSDGRKQNTILLLDEASDDPWRVWFAGQEPMEWWVPRGVPSLWGPGLHLTPTFGGSPSRKRPEWRQCQRVHCLSHVGRKKKKNEGHPKCMTHGIQSPHLIRQNALTLFFPTCFFSEMTAGGSQRGSVTEVPLEKVTHHPCTLSCPVHQTLKCGLLAPVPLIYPREEGIRDGKLSVAYKLHSLPSSSRWVNTHSPLNWFLHLFNKYAVRIFNVQSTKNKWWHLLPWRKQTTVGDRGTHQRITLMEA